MRQLVRSGLQIFLLTVCLALGARAQEQDKSSSPANAATDDTCKRASFKVLIDVGHTPDDPGAISAHGVPEYTYNMNLANAAMAQLIDAGFRQTTLLLVKGKG